MMYAPNYISYLVDHPDKLFLDELVIVLCIESTRVIADVKTAVKDIKEESKLLPFVQYQENKQDYLTIMCLL